MMEREAHFHRGPSFFNSNGVDMFQHRIDSGNVIGPRLATKSDKENHPKLWAEYLDGQTVKLDAELPKTKPKRK